jgi:hypothetical protein
VIIQEPLKQKKMSDLNITIYKIGKLLLKIQYVILYSLDLFASLMILIMSNFLVFAFYVCLGFYCAFKIIVMLESVMGVLGVLIGAAISIPIAFLFWGAIIFTMEIVNYKLKSIMVRKSKNEKIEYEQL